MSFISASCQNSFNLPKNKFTILQSCSMTTKPYNWQHDCNTHSYTWMCQPLFSILGLQIQHLCWAVFSSAKKGCRQWQQPPESLKWLPWRNPLLAAIIPRIYFPIKSLDCIKTAYEHVLPNDNVKTKIQNDSWRSATSRIAAELKTQGRGIAKEENYA